MPEATKKKPTFHDTEGRAWVLAFNLGIVRDLRDTVGFDFADLQEGRGMIEIATDHGKLAAVLWMLCEKQADAQGVNELEFASSIDSDGVEEASDALLEAIINFTQPRLRPAVQEVYDQLEKAQAVGVKTIKEWAGDAVIEEKVAAAMKEKLGDFGDLLRS